MPFEQRTVTYFICKDCNHEYPITGNPEYNKIYECCRNGCNYREAFLGLTPTEDYSVSTRADEGFLSKIWHNTIFQGILTGLIVFIILCTITMFVTFRLLDGLEERLVNTIKSEIALTKGEK